MNEARKSESKASASSINQEPGLVVSHGLSQSKWVSRFLDRLATLQPNLQSAEVLAVTTAAYRDAGDLDPELAADIYTLDFPLGQTGGA